MIHFGNTDRSAALKSWDLEAMQPLCLTFLAMNPPAAGLPTPAGRGSRGQHPPPITPPLYTAEGKGARVVATARGRPLNTRPLDVVLVLDVSGSMAGAPINMLIQSVRCVLNQLSRNRDRVRVVLFSSQVSTLLPDSGSLLTDDYFQELDDAVMALRASGGTNMQGGVLRGFELTSAFRSNTGQLPENLRTMPRNTWVLVLTDGHPNTGIYQPDELANWTREQWLQVPGTRLDLVGLGSGVNMQLLEAIENAVGGYCKLQYIDQNTALSALFADMLANAQGTVMHVRLRFVALHNCLIGVSAEAQPVQEVRIPFPTLAAHEERTETVLATWLDHHEDLAVVRVIFQWRTQPTNTWVTWAWDVELRKRALSMPGPSTADTLVDLDNASNTSDAVFRLRRILDAMPDDKKAAEQEANAAIKQIERRHKYHNHDSPCVCPRMLDDLRKIRDVALAANPWNPRGLGPTTSLRSSYQHREPYSLHEANADFRPVAGGSWQRDSAAHAEMRRRSSASHRRSSSIGSQGRRSTIGSVREEFPPLFQRQVHVSMRQQFRRILKSFQERADKDSQPKFPKGYRNDKETKDKDKERR